MGVGRAGGGRAGGGWAGSSAGCGRVRGQRVRVRPGVRGAAADRRAGAGGPSRRGVHAVRGGAHGGRADRGAAGAVGGVPAQAPRHDRDGPDPVRGHGGDPGGLRLRAARLRTAARDLGRGRRRQDRVRRGERGVPEGPRTAGRPARGERAVRVHELELHRGRAAAGRGGDQPVRPGGHRGGRRAELPALRAGHRRDPRPGGTAAAAGRQEPGAGGRTARRLAAHHARSRSAGAVPQQHARVRSDHGHRAPAGGAPPAPAPLPALAVRTRLRRALSRRTHRLPAGPPCGSPRCSPPTGSNVRPGISSPVPCRPGRSASRRPSPCAPRSAGCSPPPPARVPPLRWRDCSTWPPRSCFPGVRGRPSNFDGLDTDGDGLLDRDAYLAGIRDFVITGSSPMAAAYGTDRPLLDTHGR